MIQLPKGTFIAFGEERVPSVITLTEGEMRLFYDRAIIADLPNAVEASFGRGFCTALPAWRQEALQPIAEGYVGAHQHEIRGLCAAIILGITFADLHEGKVPAPRSAAGKPGLGGAKVPRPTAPPRKPSPTFQSL